MPTGRGWSVVGVAAGLLILAYSFGELELLAAGVAAGVAVPLAMLWVRLSTPTATVSREIVPASVGEGDDVQVRLHLTNHGRLPISSARLSDPISGLGTAGATLARLGPRSTAIVPYRLRARRRGVFTVGPVTIDARDPLGLASAARVAGPRDTLVVYPRIEALGGFPIVRGRDPSSDAAHPEFASRGGEDFYTIREYRHGDDLRRVHWPTTARRDELMIRQLETPWQSRGLVLLDTRAQVYDDEAAFETAVRGAASIHQHLRRAGFDLDLVAGSVHVRASDPDPVGMAMETLAAVQWHQSLSMMSVASRARSALGGGALVVLTGTIDDEILSTAKLLAAEHGSVSLAAVTRAPMGATAIPGTRSTLVGVLPDEPWGAAWQRMRGRSWAGA